MKRILFMSQPGSMGHFSPFVGVIQNLQRMGHHVGWVAMNDVRAAQFKQINVEVVRTGVDAPRPLQDIGWIHDDAECRQRYQKHFVDSVRPLVSTVRDAIRSFRPDVMVCDSLNFLSHICAHLESVPTIGFDTNLFTLGADSFDWRFKRLIVETFPARDALFREFGMNPRFGFLEVIAEKLNLVLTTRAFIGERTLPPNTELIGPSLQLDARGDEPADFPWDKLTPERPLILLALGTLFGRHRPEIINVVARASHRLKAQLVVAAGDATVNGPDLAGDVVLVRYAPQQALLKRVAVFVTHGGFSSMTEALTAGAPMLVTPIDADQPLNGHYVQAAGSGLSIDPDELSVNVCEKALSSLLTRPDFKKTAMRIASDYQQHDGGRKGAELIANFV